MRPLARPFGSVFVKIGLILTAMGGALAAAIGLGIVTFSSVDRSVIALQRDALPKIEASTTLIRQTGTVRDRFQDVGFAATPKGLETRYAKLAEQMTQLNATVADLGQAGAQEFSGLTANLEGLSADVRAAMDQRFAEKAALAEHLAEFQATAAQARIVLVTLEDNAVFDLAIRSEETVGTVRKILESLTEKEFSEMRAVLDIRSELNLITGLELAARKTSDVALLATMKKLSAEGVERLNAAVATLGRDNLPPEVIKAHDYLTGVGGLGGNARQLMQIRQDSDNALTAFIDQRSQALGLLATDVSDQNSTAINTLIEQQVGAMRAAAKMDIAVKNLVIAVLAGVAAPSLDEVAKKQAILNESIGRLSRAIGPLSTDWQLSTYAKRLIGFADSETGLLVSRRKVLEAEATVKARTEEAAGLLVRIGASALAIGAAATNEVKTTSSAVAQQVEDGIVQLEAIALGGVVIFVLSVLATFAFILRPLGRITRVTERLSNGDLAPVTGFERSGGEIGKMAAALSVFRSNMIEQQEMEAAEKEREAKAREDEKAAEEARIEAEAAAAERLREQEETARAEAEHQRQAMITSLSASLGSVVSAATEGDFSKRVDADFADEKLVALAHDVNALVENVEIGLASVGGAIARVAHGDLTEKMAGEFRGAFEELQTNTNEMMANLQDLLGGMGDSTRKLAASSSDLRETSETLSKRAEQNAAAIEETSAALEQLSASFKQVDLNISDANGSARTASDTAQAGQLVASEAAEAMNRIQDASTEISQVVDVINDISFQINLLALNAGVEAARAGESGRGFAVVANEVRQLAQRASSASEEIAEVISRSDAAVSDGVAKALDAEEALRKIAASVIEVSGNIDEVAVAISEQVHGVSEINGAVAQIDQNTQKQASSFEEVASAGALLSMEAEILKSASERFTVGDEPVRTDLVEPVFDEIEEAPRAAAATVAAASVPSVAGNLALTPEEEEVWEEF